MTTRVDSISAASSTNYATKPDEKKKAEEKKKQEVISFKLPDGVDYSKKSDRLLLTSFPMTPSLHSQKKNGQKKFLLRCWTLCEIL